MFTCTLGLISPEAVTTDVMSSRSTFPVWTVTTPLRLCWTVKPTMASKITAPPAMMAIFFQFFINPRSGSPVPGTHLHLALHKYALRCPKVPQESANFSFSGMTSLHAPWKRRPADAAAVPNTFLRLDYIRSGLALRPLGGSRWPRAGRALAEQFLLGREWQRLLLRKVFVRRWGVLAFFGGREGVKEKLNLVLRNSGPPPCF